MSDHKDLSIAARLDSAIEAFMDERGLVARTENDEAEIFEQFAAAVILPRHDIDPVDMSAIMMAGSHDCQLDSVAIIANGVLITGSEDVSAALSRAQDQGVLNIEVILIQATKSPRLTSEKLASFGYGALNFLNDKSALKENAKLMRLREAKNRLFGAYDAFSGERSRSIYLYFVWTGLLKTMPDGFFSLLPRALESRDKLDEIKVEPVHALRALSLWKRARAPLSASFSFPNAVPIAAAGPNASGYVGEVQAREFLRLIEGPDGEVYDRVFRDNVRHFLGDKLAVNRAIAATLNSPARHTFFMLNNGVTVVARHASRDAAGLTRLSDFQIVNGCQTSFMLSRHRDLLDEQVTLPLKIIVCDDPAISDAIVRGANSQTAVTENELMARLPFVRRLQDAVDEQRLGRRGEVLFERRLGEHAEGRHHPADHVVRIDPMLRAFCAVWLERPHDAQVRPAALRELVPQHAFHPDHELEYYIAAAGLLARGREVVGPRASNLYQLCFAARLIIDCAADMPGFAAGPNAHARARIVSVVACNPPSGRRIMKSAQTVLKRAAKSHGVGKVDAGVTRSADFTEAVRAEALKWRK